MTQLIAQNIIQCPHCGDVMKDNIIHIPEIIVIGNGIKTGNCIQYDVERLKNAYLDAITSGKIVTHILGIPIERFKNK